MDRVRSTCRLRRWRRCAGAGPAETVHVVASTARRIRGSFLISAFANIDGRRQHLGTEAVLSRWHVEGCANCQTHLEAKAFIPLHGLRDEAVHSNSIEVEVCTRDGLLSQPRAVAAALTPRRPFHFEVR